MDSLREFFIISAGRTLTVVGLSSRPAQNKAAKESHQLRTSRAFSHSTFFFLATAPPEKQPRKGHSDEDRSAAHDEEQGEHQW
jgi:hypothetical protein